MNGGQGFSLSPVLLYLHAFFVTSLGNKGGNVGLEKLLNKGACGGYSREVGCRLCADGSLTAVAFIVPVLLWRGRTVCEICMELLWTLHSLLPYS